MQVIHYPHPTLRHKSKPLRRVDRELRHMIAEMFELMYAHDGIGLAANQVDLPYRLFVLNLTADPNEKGEELVFINPVIPRRFGGQATAEEGCLSFPGIYAPVSRPAEIVVTGFDLSGNEIKLACKGLLARAVQHEFDHLDGTVFIDRVADDERLKIADGIAALEQQFAEGRKAGTIPDDDAIAARWAELEAART